MSDREYKRFAGQSVNNAGYHNHNWDLFHNGNELRDVSYPSLAAAIKAIGSEQKTLYITTQHRITSKTVIPSNISIIALKGGSFAISTGVTLTINGPFEAGLFQVFSGLGSVVLSRVRRFFPEWWGSVGDGATDDTTPITFCIDCAYASGGGDIAFTASSYAVTALSKTWTTTRSVHFVGCGKRSTSLIKLGSTTTPILTLNGGSVVEIHSSITDIRFIGNTLLSPGLRLTDCAYITLDHVWAQDCSVGLDCDGSLVFSVYEIKIQSNTIGFKARKTATHYANLIQFFGGAITGNDLFGVDYGQGMGVNFHGTDIESNGLDEKDFTVDTGTDTATITSTEATTGTMIRVSNTGGGLPAPLVAATDYFWIRLTATTGKFATTLVNALASTAIDITTAGSGTNTIAFVGSGGVMLRETIDDETGFGLVSFDNTWFEGNKGRAIQSEAGGGAFISVTNCTFANNENRPAWFESGRLVRVVNCWSLTNPDELYISANVSKTHIEDCSFSVISDNCTDANHFNLNDNTGIKRGYSKPLYANEISIPISAYVTNRHRMYNDGSNRLKFGSYNSAGFVFDGGPVVFADGAYNETHPTFGSYHLWLDALKVLRMKNGTPGSATDGNLLMGIISSLEYFHGNHNNSGSYKIGSSGAAVSVTFSSKDDTEQSFTCSDLSPHAAIPETTFTHNAISYTVNRSEGVKIYVKEATTGALSSGTLASVDIIYCGLMLDSALVLKAYQNLGMQSKRFLGAKGADVASSNDLTLGGDGNLFSVTGATQINRITITSWQAGAEITLHFASTPTVKHQGAATTGSLARLNLAGSVDFVAAANSRIKLYYDGTDWWEISRTSP